MISGRVHSLCPVRVRMPARQYAALAGEPMNRYLLLLPATALLIGAGCSAFNAAGTDDYDRGQAPASRFAKDGEICARQAEADQKQFGTGGENDPTHTTYNRMFDACMRASGYRRKPEP